MSREKLQKKAKKKIKLYDHCDSVLKLNFSSFGDFNPDVRVHFSEYSIPNPVGFQTGNEFV